MGSIRSEYIKNLMAEKNSLSDTLAEATKESLRGILKESVNKGIRQILSEASDEFEEEEITTDTDGKEETEETATDTETGSAEAPEGEVDDTPAEDTPADDPAADDIPATDGEDEGEGEDDVWGNLDSYLDADGEYDLTGMSDEEMIKVMKVMNPEKDGVRIVKNDDNTVTLTDENNDTEYIIDLGGAETEEDADEMTIGESRVNETDLGYTDDYQKQTAMTMPSDDGKGGQFDAGAPKGSANNSKRWVGKNGDMSPYKEKADAGDEMIFEIEMDECGMSEGEEIEEQSRFGKANEKGMHKTPKSDKDHTVYGSHVISREGRYTGNEPDGTANESVNRRLKAIMQENKELKGIAKQFQSKLNEAVVINASLAKIIQLVTENSTTKEEKMDIVKRFNKVTTLNECKSLYETIDGELKKSHTINGGVETLIASPVNESKPVSQKDMIVETTLLNSPELANTIDLMRRMEKCGR